MSDSPTDGLSPLMDMRVKLTKANKENERLTIDVERWKSIASQIESDWIPANRKLSAEIIRLTKLSKAEIERLRVEQAEYEEEIERLTLVAQTHIDAVVGMSERIAKLEGGVEHAIDAFRNHGLTNTAQFKKLLAIAEVDDE